MTSVINNLIGRCRVSDVPAKRPVTGAAPLIRLGQDHGVMEAEGVHTSRGKVGLHQVHWSIKVALKMSG